MSEIAGVTKQREGAIHQNETASGVERSVNQSSHITEYWFHTHEKTKLRVLQAYLETAKVALKGTNKKVQYILDDQTIQMLNIDGGSFNEADYGIVCTSSTKAQELEQLLKTNAQAFIQNGGSMSSIIDIFFSPSLSDMRRKLEMTEAELQQRQAKGQEDANALAKQAQESAMELEQAKLQLEEQNNIRDNDTKLQIAGMNSGEEAEDGIEDTETTLDRDKHNLDINKVKKDHLIKMKALDDNMLQHKDKMEREDKKIAVSRSKPTAGK